VLITNWAQILQSAPTVLHHHSSDLGLLRRHSQHFNPPTHSYNRVDCLEVQNPRIETAIWKILRILQKRWYRVKMFEWCLEFFRVMAFQWAPKRVRPLHACIILITNFLGNTFQETFDYRMEFIRLTPFGRQEVEKNIERLLP